MTSTTRTSGAARATGGTRRWLRSPPVIAAIAAGALAVLVLIVWGLPILLTRRPVVTGADRHSAMSDVRSALITLLAGIGAVVGVVYTARTFRLSQVSHLTGRFQEASRQMGEEDPTVRLGGIQGMAQLADEWEDQRQRCVDVLCAYVRNRSSAGRANAERAAGETPVDDDRDNRRRAIEILFQRLRPGGPKEPTWIGCDFDLRNAMLDVGDLARAELSAGHLDFTGATFTGDLSFEETVFSGARVSFDGATFAPVHAISLRGARFAAGQVSFDQAYFEGGTVDFSDARFVGCAVSFERAHLGRGGSVAFDRARFAGEGMCGATFAGAVFEGDEHAKVSFSGAAFEAEVCFDGATFGGDLSFDGAALAPGGLSMQGATFRRARLTFRDATCAGATLRVAEAKGMGLDLAGADGRPTFDPPEDLPVIPGG